MVQLKRFVRRSRYSLLRCIAMTYGMFVMYFGRRLFISLNKHEYLVSRSSLLYIYNNTPVWNKLVDMNEVKAKPQSTFKSIRQILFINTPFWLNIAKGNAYIRNKCHFKNCVMTNKVNNISQMSAVVFSTPYTLKYGCSYLKSKRPYSQVWVFMTFEPPEASRQWWYRDPIWRKTMNWSWGYRLDSDIFRPIQVLTTRNVLPNRDNDTIFKRKKKLAAWVVSHCHVKSLRDEYVHALIREGVQVDIFGKCSKNRTNVSRKDIQQRINDDYKFYLSFENNICKDYVTEKFYTYLGLDTILVVRGGLNYSKHFNQNSFIDTSSFSTVKSLASYMLKVSQDIKLYTGYLRNKDMYNIAGSGTNSMYESECRLCEKINNQERYKKTYEDIATYIHNDTCFNPHEIL
ncbi:alpha-(1,3)-fucosyltransferase C-like [Mercenaria mercenaria]|uniref:alpha-(1,3)-fucosyltransferase C-like n=1 Tax=Mercenaria mercenaria TaxID=6596 RepID=UPI00234F089E|nr:alpha-(1,3)-fucosyltransferase C-like [Mercenaria mercenaria]XP_045185056.2 alpha-(1,3)-fucosyltransferase C-like [Mercenaria mercenaria]